jgi:endoglucanase
MNLRAIHPCRTDFVRSAAGILSLSLLVVLILTCGGANQPSQPVPSQPVSPTSAAGIAFPLHTSGRFIVDSNGNRVRLKAFDWYGAEGPDEVVGGLAYQSIGSIAAELHSWGFNAVRLLWSNQMYETNAVVANGLLTANPNLVGMHALNIFDQVVDTLASNHLMVILDNHVSDAIWCCSNSDGNGLWYNGTYPETSWINDWQGMARRYLDQPDVIGADLRNEPRCTTVNGATLCATWGGPADADWHAAAERGGNAVLSVNPNLLVFVEGVDYAGDLSGVASLPVVLSQPDRVVYEAHNYGFFYSSNPLSSYNDWVNRITPRWGYLVTSSNPQPLWIGEFGTCNTSDSCVSSTNNSDLGFWFQIITRYIQSNSLDWGYWPVNGTDSDYPNASRTYGELENYGILNTVWNAPSLSSLLNQLQTMMP